MRATPMRPATREASTSTGDGSEILPVVRAINTKVMPTIVQNRPTGIAQLAAPGGPTIAAITPPSPIPIPMAVSIRST